ncbi:MAG: hypothetical protein ABR554_04715 [Pyrinomonadaceae bacterium]
MPRLGARVDQKFLPVRSSVSHRSRPTLKEFNVKVLFSAPSFRMRSLFLLAGLLAVLGLLGGGIAPLSGNHSTALAQTTSTPNRAADPVVLTGADVPGLNGIAPASLVAFRYTTDWQQIPLQVDERAVVDLGTVYNSTPTGVKVLSYTDPRTFTGADPDATLDQDDEIALMVKDSGGKAPYLSEPAGNVVVPRSGVEVTITDPLSPAQASYVYLFKQTGALSQGAGKQYVSYQFNLLSGDYKATYKTNNGPNPENSVITSPSFYSHHFADRWIDDELHVFAGTANRADILDRHKNLFAPGDCMRSEDTFSSAEGAFVVNKSGPVRAIRAYLGANSGPLTERQHIFYEQRQEITTFLRVHAIGGMMDFFDYSPAAKGMKYYNDLNRAGVTIDGLGDAVGAGPIQWEMVNGAQGALAISHAIATDIPGFAYSSYYLDASTRPADRQCTGDKAAYGSSGTWITQGIACTDPSKGCTNNLTSTRTISYEAPGLTAPGAEQRNKQVNHPLTYTVQSW